MIVDVIVADANAQNGMVDEHEQTRQHFAIATAEGCIFIDAILECFVGV